MLTPQGLRVLEFNARLGDPETQPILMRLRGDLVPALVAAARGDLSRITLDIDPRVSIGVVVAAEGYPGKVTTGDPIHGLDATFGDDQQLFQAGTASGPGGQVVSAGGRVLTVCALGATHAEARARAYQALGQVSFRGMQFRTDIGGSA
jgi:phosphoribosylamine--glycine ligase